MMENVLVMGGSYFIGKHIVDALKNDYKVTVLNRGNHPLNDAFVNELKADRNDLMALTSVLRDLTFEHVIDVSAYNAMQLDNLVKSLNMDALKTFVFVSTGAVYDVKNPLPMKETDPLGGKSPYKDYATNKIECENYLYRMIHKEKRFIIRPPYVYGEDNYLLRERLFFHLIEHDEPIYIPKSNDSIQFVYVKDLAQITKSMVDHTLQHGTYNIGTKEGIKFDAFVRLCGKVMEKEATIIWVDDETIPPTHYFPFYPMDYLLDVSKLNHQFVFETPLIEGLKNAYRDYLTLDNLTLPKRMIEARIALKK